MKSKSNDNAHRNWQNADSRAFYLLSESQPFFYTNSVAAVKKCLHSQLANCLSGSKSICQARKTYSIRRRKKKMVFHTHRWVHFIHNEIYRTAETHYQCGNSTKKKKEKIQM